MARPKKSQPDQEQEAAPVKAAAPSSLILTVSQHASLSDEERQAFRDNGGTVTSDPQ
jgi:hypothetical protein